MLMTEFKNLVENNPSEAVEMIAKGDIGGENKIGDMPLLSFAISRNQLAVAAALLSKGADPNEYVLKGENRGKAPIHFVNSVQAVELLVSNKAVVDSPYKFVDSPYFGRGETALQSLVMKGKTSDIELIDSLLRSGANQSRPFKKTENYPDESIDRKLREITLGEQISALRLKKENEIEQLRSAHLQQPINTISNVTALPAQTSTRSDGVTENPQPPVVVDFIKKSPDLGSSEPQFESKEIPAAPVVPVKNSPAISELSPSLPTVLLGGKFARNDRGEYEHSKDKNVKVIDQGEKLELGNNPQNQKSSKDLMAASIELVKHKGWTNIEIGGSDEFKREAWFQAKAVGLNVIGYTPDSQDLIRLSEIKPRIIAENSKPEIHVAEELQEARNFALKAGGIRSVNKSQDTCVGPIVYSNSQYIVQDLGRKQMVIHDRADVTGVGVEGKQKNGKEVVKIHYEKGSAKVVEKPVKEKSFGLSR